MDYCKKYWYVGLFAIVLGLLVFRNTPVLASILPFGLVLLCPLMMFFMMRSHGDHHDNNK